MTKKRTVQSNTIEKQLKLKKRVSYVTIFSFLLNDECVRDTIFEDQMHFLVCETRVVTTPIEVVLR